MFSPKENHAALEIQKYRVIFVFLEVMRINRIFHRPFASFRIYYMHVLPCITKCTFLFVNICFYECTEQNVQNRKKWIFLFLDLV